jgi:hypothetical protein
VSVARGVSVSVSVLCPAVPCAVLVLVRGAVSCAVPVLPFGARPVIPLDRR